MAVSSLSDLESAAVLFRSLGHPLRLRIVVALDENAVSPSDLGQRFDVALGLVAYHVRALRDDGLVERVDTRAARGSLQSFLPLERSRPDGTHRVGERVRGDERRRRASMT